jgi:hypothetical protein
MSNDKMPPKIREALELLREPHERGFAMAQARLALRMRYNPQTILHWCSGRRVMGSKASETLEAVVCHLHRER